MRFVFLSVIFLVAFADMALASDNNDYNDLQKQARELSRAIRLTEDRDLHLAEALENLEKERQQLITAIHKDRYITTVSLHHLLSQNMYPAQISFLKADKNIYDRYYDYRISQARHQYYQSALQNQIAHKLALDEKTTRIHHFQDERKMIELVLQENMNDLAAMKKNRPGMSSADLAAFKKSIENLQNRHKDLNRFIESLTGTRWKGLPTARTLKKDSGFYLPVSGTIHTLFNEVTAWGGQSSGIYIKARNKALITAPLSGHVLFAGTFNRLGNIIIIEHRDNYLSILKGVDDLYVQTGDIVDQNEALGIFTQENPKESYIGTMFYYELRYNDNPVNPLNKLAG